MRGPAPPSEIPDFRGLEALHPISLSELAFDHPIRLFYDHWTELAQVRGGIPRREDFRHAAVKPALPWITVLERTGPPEDGDYLLRLQGTAASEHSMGNWTGTRLSERFADGGFEARRDEFDRVLASGQPSFSQGILTRGGIRWEFTRGVFPFVTQDGRQQIFFLGVSRHAKL